MKNVKEAAILPVYLKATSLAVVSQKQAVLLLLLLISWLRLHKK